MRVLIIDDHPMVIEGCRGILANQKDIDVVEAHDAADAMKVFATAPPDVTVLDINLPGVSGFELLHRLLKRSADAKVIVFTMNDDPVFAARSIDQGAKGYLTKNEDPKAFVKAIRSVAAGEQYLSTNLALKLAFSDRNFARNPLESLSRREIEILRNLASGKDMTEIAHILGISYKTVANNCLLLKRKLGVRSKADLLRFAVENMLAMKLV
jgi:two-component system, NarL family, invasion response regulator UvrY